MTNRYRNIPVREDQQEKVYSSSVYSIVPESTDDYYVISTIGDRFDVLAQEYYNDSKLWYILAAANPTVRRDTLFIEPGIQIRIPLPLSKVVRKLNSENSNR